MPTISTGPGPWCLTCSDPPCLESASAPCLEAVRLPASLIGSRLEVKATVVAEMDLLIAARAIAAHAVLVAHGRIFKKREGLAATAEGATDLAQKGKQERKDWRVAGSPISQISHF